MRKQTDRLKFPSLSNSMYTVWFIKDVKVYMISKYRKQQIIGRK